jgi:hypothetical protein
VESAVLEEGRHDGVLVSVRGQHDEKLILIQCRDRLLLEFARVMSVDRAAMDYVG